MVVLIQVSSLEEEIHYLKERNTSSLTSLQGECDQHTTCTGVVDGRLQVHAFEYEYTLCTVCLYCLYELLCGVRND